MTMILQQEYLYEMFDYFQNDVVSEFDTRYNPISSSLVTFSGSMVEQQSHLVENLSSLSTRFGSNEEPPKKKRRRRRKTRSEKKIEDKENQRMNHIAAERNRRKQMNQLLSILKSMMPHSYSQRSDQASIIEGTINYLKKQEQLLQSLEAKFKTSKPNQPSNIFTSSTSDHHKEQLTAVADVEVTVAPERHANIKVSTKTRPRLLFNIINEFNSLGLRTLHINFATSNDISLFTCCVKVEEDCQLTTTVDEVANVVHEVFRRIHKQN